MLLTLSIRDIVLIDRLDLSFHSGLCVMTGETGAGKSILLDALGLALGERGDTGLIRQGCKRALVSAEFEMAGNAGLLAMLEEHALPADYAEAFPMFDAGDLLVSLRSGNLIFVVDPDTGEIVWWMQDGSFGQHDPDWQADGSILLFDNNTDYGSSRVIRINPAMKSYEIVLDGNDLGFYTDLMGNQHRCADGATILALAREGRAVEYADDGTLLFEFINLYDEAEQRRGLVTEARTLPLAFLDNLPECDD